MEVEVEPIIKSMIDNDAYKLTMGFAAFRLYPDDIVEYEFIDRGDTDWPDGFADELEKQIVSIGELEFTCDDIRFLSIRYPNISNVYWEWLRGYRFDPKEVDVIRNNEKFAGIHISGYWYRTIWWEVPLMAIVSELYFKMIGIELDVVSNKKLNETKAKIIADVKLKLSDFGTRRRHSFVNHRQVLKDLKNVVGNSFGTSNLYFAKELNLDAVGTIAHEWIMFHAAKYGFCMSNRMAMDKWTELYGCGNNIALTDTFTTDVFLRSFDRSHAMMFDGVRHDSGDPLEFFNKIVSHYDKLGIDSSQKTIVFSDGLNVISALNINEYCRGRINAAFGIGTNLTNDVGVNPLNIVIKMVKVGDVPVIKLSDVDGKNTGDNDMIQCCKYQFGIK